MNFRFTLPPEFWAHFVEHHWEKAPLLIQQPFAPPFATPAEIFRSLVEASHHFRTVDASIPIRFFIGNTLLQAGAESKKHVPDLNDESTAGYAERVTRMLDGRQFALVINHLQEHDAELWARMRAFLRGLHEFIGIPAQYSYSDVFLGNYESTPFGVHQDPASNFMFIIEGRKRMRLWADDFFRDKGDMLETLDYERFLDGAVTLEGGPGDVIYWPSSYWHVGESVGGLAVCLNISLWLKWRASEDVFGHIIRMVRDRLGTSDAASLYPFHLKNLHKTGGMMPQQMKRVAAALREVSQQPDFEQALKVSWLNRVTGFGFTRVPPPLPWKTLADDEVVRGDPHYPVVWMSAGEHKVVCSANGHSFTIPADPSLLKLLKRLNSGKAFRVKNLVEEHAGITRTDDVEFKATPEGIRTLLEKLYTLRALTESLTNQQRGYEL